MPLLQVLRCKDCGHEWDTIDQGELATVGVVDFWDDRSFSLYSCPLCYLRLFVQREADGNSWRHWRRNLPPASNDPASQLAVLVAARITQMFASRGSMYRPVTIELDAIDCLRCGVRLVPGPVEPPPPDCPECHSPRVIDTGAGGIVTLFVE